MFNKKKELQIESKTIERSIIGVGTKITGDLISEGDFRIDGTIEGNLKTAGRVIIGKRGYIKGSIECANADIEGEFTGDLIVSDLLTAKSTAIITGNINASQVSTEPGSIFNTTFKMKETVKELTKQPDDKKSKQKTA